MTSSFLPGKRIIAALLVAAEAVFTVVAMANIAIVLWDSRGWSVGHDLGASALLFVAYVSANAAVVSGVGAFIVSTGRRRRWFVGGTAAVAVICLVALNLFGP